MNSRNNFKDEEKDDDAHGWGEEDDETERLHCFLPFFLNRLFVTAQPSKKHGHELRVVKKFPVTRLQRLQAESRALMNERVRSATPQETRHLCRMKSALFGAMANVGILEQIWRVNPIWSITFLPRGRPRMHYRHHNHHQNGQHQ